MTHISCEGDSFHLLEPRYGYTLELALGLFFFLYKVCRKEKWLGKLSIEDGIHPFVGDRRVAINLTLQMFEVS